MCTEVTESADGQPPPQSSSTMCTQSAGGQPPPQSSQSACGQPPPQSSSTMCTQSAGAQPPARPPPSKTGASLPTSPEGPHIIAYVHNLSPLKRNKRNTIDYTTLTLQTDATTTQPALCYSKTKRKLLHEHETKRAPIKISRYSKSGDKTKIVINDKTLLAKPDDMDNTFQYYDDADQPVTPLNDLLKDDAKVVKVSESRGNKVSEVTLLDTTGTMTLDLWNEQIAQVQIDCVYRFTSLSTSYWNDSKKLSSTINTAIEQSFQPDLCSLQFKESDDTGHCTRLGYRAVFLCQVLNMVILRMKVEDLYRCACVLVVQLRRLRCMVPSFQSYSILHLLKSNTVNSFMISRSCRALIKNIKIGSAG